MGCIVNDPAMADADYGHVGKAGGKIALYRGREVGKESVPQEQGVAGGGADQADGKWWIRRRAALLSPLARRRAALGEVSISLYDSVASCLPLSMFLASMWVRRVSVEA
jgi:hypothetical protein